MNASQHSEDYGHMNGHLIGVEVAFVVRLSAALAPGVALRWCSRLRSCGVSVWLSRRKPSPQLARRESIFFT
jgi:hypothetical protein